jgi:hypothetical protein
MLSVNLTAIEPSKVSTPVGRSPKLEGASIIENFGMSIFTPTYPLWLSFLNGLAIIVAAFGMGNNGVNTYFFMT